MSLIPIYAVTRLENPLRRTGWALCLGAPGRALQSDEPYTNIRGHAPVSAPQNVGACDEMPGKIGKLFVRTGPVLGPQVDADYRRGFRQTAPDRRTRQMELVRDFLDGKLLPP